VVANVVVAVGVAGVICVGHGHDDEDVHGHVNDHDHHLPVAWDASVSRGKVSPSAAFRDVAALVVG